MIKRVSQKWIGCQANYVLAIQICMELFERAELVLKIKGHSRQYLAKRLGVAQVTFNRYFNKENQDKLAAYLWSLLEVYPDLRRDWLFFGEGDPFDAAPAPVSALPEPALPTPLTLPEAPHDMQPIPLVGFASCSVQGWYGTMTIPVPVEPPKWHGDMLAVMATGESMLPAGIGHGHICYCDPTKTPGVDEAVYVETMDGLGTIKLFCGWSERGGSSFLNLRGWLDKDPETDRQKAMTLDTAAFYIRRIAPVIYVRRRL